VITLKPAMILFITFLAYAVSGPVMTLVLLKKTRAQRQLQKQQKNASMSANPSTEEQE